VVGENNAIFAVWWGLMYSSRPVQRGDKGSEGIGVRRVCLRPLRPCRANLFARLAKLFTSGQLPTALRLTPRVELLSLSPRAKHFAKLGVEYSSAPPASASGAVGIRLRGQQR
jgi:hypothetical protein